MEAARWQATTRLRSSALVGQCYSLGSSALVGNLLKAVPPMLLLLTVLRLMLALLLICSPAFLVKGLI